MESKSYFLVFTADSAQLIPLPENGSLLLCMSPQGGVVVAGEARGMARARLDFREGWVQMESLPDGGGVQVNDRALAGVRTLLSGDVIALEQARLVFHRDPRAGSRQPVLDHGALMRRLVQEVERAARYGHPLALLVLRLEPEPGEPDGRRAAEAVARQVRCVDIVAWDGAGEVVVIFPETGEDARIPAERVLGALTRHGPAARAGLALFPEDGGEAGALLTGARDAAARARPEEPGRPGATTQRVQIGGKELLVADPKMRQLLDLVRSLAGSSLPVLVVGETGVGKEIIARAVHHWSPRREGRLVTLNCAAVPESLLESELFGHEKGAFSGALSAKPGLLEVADGGTLFLDEVGESSPRAQAELLRVLETGQMRRVGAVDERRVDVRLVSATNRPLEQEVSAGRFRRDLYYRLNAATLMVPPLRDRPLDLPALVRHFLQKGDGGRAPALRAVSPEAMRRLQQHTWPGNVRELKNLLAYLQATVPGPVLEPGHLPPELGLSAPWPERPRAGGGRAAGSREETPAGQVPLAEEIRALERRRMEQALAEADGVRTRAAQLIGMPLRTFVTRMKQHGLSSWPRQAKNDT